MRREEAEALYAEARRIHEMAYRQVLNWIARHQPWDLVVHLGDMTSGWQEQGLAHPSVVDLAHNCWTDLATVGRRVRVAIGNHETGYTHAGALKTSGITVEAVATCEQIFGDLFWVEESEGLVHLGIASPLAEYDGHSAYLQALKRRQSEFVRDTLQQHNHAPWILYAHDPKTPFHLEAELGPHLDRLTKFIFGDKHVPWMGSVERILGYLPRNHVLASCLRNSLMCPSTAPVWWEGHAYLMLQVDGSKVAGQRQQLPLTPGTLELPTSDTLRCAGWMVLP